MNERCTDLDAHGINRAIARVNENEHCESCCNNSSKVIKKIRYIGVDFDDTKIRKCEDDVNNALSQGYEPLRDIDTPRGLILVLGLYGKKVNKFG
tara:strand:+ start:30 stop:314 length:285 start_codon:yes stop_codon:yes gene_type:complete